MDGGHPLEGVDSAVSVVMDDFVDRKDAVADEAIDASGLDMEDDEHVTVAVVLHVDVRTKLSKGRLQMKRVCGKPGVWRKPYFQFESDETFDEGYLDGYLDVRGKLTEMFVAAIGAGEGAVKVDVWAELMFDDEGMMPFHPQPRIVARVMQALAGVL